MRLQLGTTTNADKLLEKISAKSTSTDGLTMEWRQWKEGGCNREGEKGENVLDKEWRQSNSRTVEDNAHSTILSLSSPAGSTVVWCDVLPKCKCLMSDKQLC